MVVIIVQRSLIFLAVVCCCFAVLAKATNYLVIGESENLVEACSKEDDHGNTRYEDFLDITNVKRTYSDDLETIYYDGDMVVKMSIPNKPIIIESDIYSWERGEWVNTIYSLRRTDFCASFQSPLELWYSIVKQIPKKQRICPPKKGIIYTLTNTTNQMKLTNMPVNNLDGTYKAVSHMKVDNFSMCTTIRVTISKI